MDAAEYFELRTKVIELLNKEADALHLAAELMRTGNLTQPPWICEVLRSADLSRAERAVLVEQLMQTDPFSKEKKSPPDSGL